MSTEVTMIAQTGGTGNPITLKELRSFEAATRGWAETVEFDIQNTTVGPMLEATVTSVQP